MTRKSCFSAKVWQTCRPSKMHKVLGDKRDCPSPWAQFMKSNNAVRRQKMEDELRYQMELSRLGEIIEREVGEAIEYWAEVLV